MLTDLEFLQLGKKFPPKSEQERLERYADNKKLYESKQDEVYEDQLKRIRKIVGNFDDVFSYPTVLNYNKIISVKSADLLLGEPPHIQVGEQGSTEDQTFKNVAKNSDLLNTLYQVALDISRYGDGILYIYKNDDNQNILGLTQTPMWFPVVNVDNIKEVKYHILAWNYTDIINNVSLHRLKVQVHDKGRYLEIIWGLESKTGIIQEEISRQEYITGLDDFAVVPISNTITSDMVYGEDDYRILDTLIAELMVRVSQINLILDKHADPSIQGPMSALDFDPVANEYRLKLGNFFARSDSNDPEISYITWNAELQSNFDQVERIINFIYTISEMGSAIFGDLMKQTGQVPSGSALKRLMISPLAKVNRIRTRFDSRLKKAIDLVMQLEGYKDLEISINWQDGLPDDKKEETEIFVSATGGKTIMSQYNAVRYYQRLDDDQTEEEIERIHMEDALENPMNGTNMPLSNMSMEVMEEEEAESNIEMSEG